MDIPRARLTDRDKLCAAWKQCSWCRQNLPISPKWYHQDRNKKDGYKDRCKVCTKILVNFVDDHKPHISENTPEQNRKIDTLQDKHRLLGRIAAAAKTAEYAADGIVLDGRKLTIPIKVCSTCHTQYPATTDHFNKCGQSKKDGLSGICKNCVNTPRRKHRKANRPRMFSVKYLKT